VSGWRCCPLACEHGARRQRCCLAVIIVVCCMFCGRGARRQMCCLAVIVVVIMFKKKKKLHFLLCL